MKLTAKFTFVATALLAAVVVIGCSKIDWEEGKRKDRDTSKDYCANLKTKMSKVDKGSDEWNKLMRLYNAKCGDVKKDDKGDDDYCANLRKKMSKVRKGSDDYNELLRMYNAKCGKKDGEGDGDDDDGKKRRDKSGDA